MIKLFMVATMFLITSCYKEPKYEVVDYRKSINDTIHVWTVYAPDTNWNDMARFAQHLVKEKGKICSVGFFYPREKTPNVDSNFNLMPIGSMKYLLATYRYDSAEGGYMLIK